MEEIQDDCQSPSDWGSMQDLASWSINDPEKDEVIDLKRAGTTVSMVTINNTTPSWIKILQHAQGPPAQASTCPGPSEVCQRPSG